MGRELQLQGLNEKISNQKLVLEKAQHVGWDHVIEREEKKLKLLEKQAAVKKKELQRAKTKLKKEELQKAIPRIGVLHRYIKQWRPYITNRANPDMKIVGGIRKAQQELSEIYENLKKKCDIPLKNVLILDRSHPENPTIEKEAHEKAKAYRERLYAEQLQEKANADRRQAKWRVIELWKKIRQDQCEIKMSKQSKAN